MIKSSSPRVAERLIEATEQRGENGKWPTDAETHYNVVLQIQTPSHAYRLIRMHGDPEIKSRMLPEVETVAEVANRPTGEGMVLLRGLSTPCINFKRWLDSSLLRFNITRAYFVEGGCCATNEDVSTHCRHRFCI